MKLFVTPADNSSGGLVQARRCAYMSTPFDMTKHPPSRSAHVVLGHETDAAPRSGYDMIRGIGIRPIIFSVNCYIATILTMFIAFSLDLKSPGWAMTTVYLTSQPLSGVLRAKAV